MNIFPSVISDLRHELAENCALLGHYAASSGNFLLTFRDNLSVPPSFLYFRTLKLVPVARPETSLTNYRHSLRNDTEERSS